ncbi:RepB family plasmid replication initiator protein [Candidatus Competibacter phosphatis]|nr:RepB family plasmid replication initiator protein [Candidatus Competibacter phosphatis]
MMSILAKPKYAFPLYEILSDCYSRGEKSARLSLRELKESLGIMGPYYDNFVAFKKGNSQAKFGDHQPEY